MTQNNQERRSSAAFIPLIFSAAGLAGLALFGSSGKGLFGSHSTTRIRTPQETVQLKLEGMEAKLNAQGMDYKSFIEFSGIKREQPSDYDSFRINVDLVDDMALLAHYMDLNQKVSQTDFGGPYIQIYVAESKAKDLVEKIR